MATQVPTNSQGGLGGHPLESNPNTTVTKHWPHEVSGTIPGLRPTRVSRFAPDVSSYCLDLLHGRRDPVREEDVTLTKTMYAFSFYTITLGEDNICARTTNRWQR